MRFLSLTIAALLCFSLPAHADEGCFDSDPVVDRQEAWDFNASPRSDFYLPTRNVYGEFSTWAATHIHWDKNETLQVQFDHMLPAHLVGLPYTVHRLEIKVGDQVYSEDFTRNCTEPGLSFFPRETVSLPAIKLSAPAFAPIAPVHIRIWGHL